MSDPRVTVVVSGLNEEAFIGRCLDAVLAQDYPHDRLSVIYVDGGSTDGTVAAVERRAEADPRLTILADGTRRNLPDAMNVGLARSDGDFTAKVDAHGWPERDFVRRAVEAFASSPGDVACVGGRPEQRGDGPWGIAVARARMSRFGTGGSVYAGTSAREFVDTVQCGVYRTDVLRSAGGFDPAMAFGEDDELNWRLRAAGYRILLDASIRFHYVARDSFGGVFRQYRNYGRAKVGVIAKHPSFARPWHFAPAAAVIGGTSLAALALISPRARVAAGAALVAYTGAATAAAAKETHGDGLQALARTAACFAAIHVGYGVGMVEGAAGLVRG